MRFGQTIQASMPDMPLPQPILLALDWLESHGAVETGHDGQPFATLYSDNVWGKPTGRSSVAFEPSLGGAWMPDKPEVQERLNLFVRTGGDGSYAGLWRDDEGGLRFVHFGSGSGSTWLGVITDDPIQFLRFLAIGYSDACWQEEHPLSPTEAYKNVRGGDGPPFDPPVHFQRWLIQTFDVSIPETASEIVQAAPGMDDEISDDPFWQWSRRVQDAA